MNIVLIAAISGAKFKYPKLIKMKSKISSLNLKTNIYNYIIVTANKRINERPN